jgi:hypothetical protein
MRAEQDTAIAGASTPPSVPPPVAPVPPADPTVNRTTGTDPVA